MQSRHSFSCNKCPYVAPSKAMLCAHLTAVHAIPVTNNAEKSTVENDGSAGTLVKCNQGNCKFFTLAKASMKIHMIAEHGLHGIALSDVVKELFSDVYYDK